LAVRWIFLDVGNVLLDEGPLTYLSFRRHAEAACEARPGWTFLDALAAREAKAAAGSRWPVYEALVPILGEGGCAAVWAATDREVRARFAELSPPVPGAAAVVGRLSRAGYRLGLIANQGPEARDRLDALGMLGAFEVVALSEEVGHSKPDPALFRHALEQAGARGDECLMVGDRLDNDVAPAAAVGMSTVWVRWPDPAARGWRPTEPEALAYLASLQRGAPRDPGPDISPPTLAIDGLDGLDAAIANATRPGGLLAGRS
jgi:5'-nucleotidase